MSEVFKVLMGWETYFLMSQLAVKFENVSKMYQLGTIGTGTIGHDFNRWFVTQVLRKPDPYLRIGETNNRSTKGRSDFVYALHDISLELMEGEVLGIIGKNGAGKSTLLKLLSNVTTPTLGRISVNGRIASLLEVGTGFHGELTGKENIYMNGAILGMKKWEIDKQMDAIVEFSGCERYLDTPVKRYSSGMLVRLGFAVAAHLEPEILVVDEVLSVGDAEFQKRAVGKIRDVAQNSGRTVLFVSHNMASVRALCTKGMLLENGTMTDIGDTDHIIEEYLRTTQEIKTTCNFEGDEAPGDKNIKLRHASLIGENGHVLSNAYIDKKVGLVMEYEVLHECEAFNPAVYVTNDYGIELFSSHNTHKMNRSNVQPGRYRTIMWIPANIMNTGEAVFGFTCFHYTPDYPLWKKVDAVKIEYLDSLSSPTRNEDYRGTTLPGVVRPAVQWDNITKI